MEDIKDFLSMLSVVLGIWTALLIFAVVILHKIKENIKK